MNTEKNSEAVRRARREVFGKVRTDWDDVLGRTLPHLPRSYLPYQWTPEALNAENIQAKNAADTARHPFREADLQDNPREGLLGFTDAQDTAGGDALDWCERTYCPSDPSSDEDGSSSISLVGSLLGKIGIGSKNNSKTRLSSEADQNTDRDAYASGLREDDPDETFADFGENEDSLDADDLEYWKALSKEDQKKLLRARRRRRRVEKEMQWNQGLRYWEMRRDVWCCAKPCLPASCSTSRNSGENSLSQSISDPDTQATTATSSSTHTNYRSSQDDSLCETSGMAPHTQPTSDNDSPEVYQAPTTTNTTAAAAHPAHPAPQMLLPVAPPLLAETDPTRAKVSPSAYSGIYSKLVTRSLSPSVPLNLSVVVPSLVAGWKESGEWPTGTPADPTIFVDPRPSTADKRVLPSGNSIGSALADATKNGLRALGGRTSPSTASKKADAKRRATARLKSWPSHGPAAQAHDDKPPTSNPTQNQNNAASKSPTQEPERSSQTSTSSPKAMFLSRKSRASPASTPDKGSPNRGANGAEADKNDSTGALEQSSSSPKRVRKRVAKVGKVLKGGFTASSTPSDGGGAW